MVVDTLLDIERTFWESSGDQAFYEAHVAEGGRFVLSMGVMDKGDVVASMADAEPWESYDILNPTEVPIREGVVGLIYEATGRRKADADPYQATILSVYTQSDGHWQMILHQQTPIEASEAQ